MKERLKRLNHGLRWEILVSLGILMLGGVAFMGTTSLKAAERTLLLQRMESLTMVTRSLQMSLAARWGRDDSPLAIMVNNAAAGLGMSDFVVVDDKAVIVAALRDAGLGRRSDDPYLQRALASRSLVLPTQVSPQGGPGPGSTWTFAAPVFDGSRLSGAFAVTYPLENLGLTLRLHRKVIFTFAFIDGLFIVLFGGWLIGRVAIGPLVRISHGAEAFAAGDYNARVEEKGAREIVTVARSFNLLASRVQDLVVTQERHLEALEEANRDLKAAQTEMIRVEKLASVGRLSAGIAHEIGNPLSAVLGYAAILQREEEDPEKLKHLAYIEQETERIQRIIGELLEFARPREVKVQPLAINDLVRDTVNLVKPQEDMAGVTVELNLEEPVPPVAADRYQLQQAVLNVIVNGAQAMGGEGELRVTTRAREITEEDRETPVKRATDGKGADYAAVRRASAQPVRLEVGDRVVSIMVEDSGPGVAPEVMEKIFDPFYTTKEPGRGTGLGLSVTFGIVNAHGGRMHIRNRREGGARVTIDIPVAVQAGTVRSVEP